MTATVTYHGILHILALALLTQEGSGLKWAKFSVPSWAGRGEDATLTCDFDLQGDQLYSVKWYKAGREFYRYVPAEWPPQQAFKFPGGSLDLHHSDSQHVRLLGVNLNAAGRYKCEVLTEAPHFKTLVKSAVMHVVELPRGIPQVTGGQSEYRPEDLINLTCTAPLSIPPAQLTWYINDQQAPQEYLEQYPGLVDAEGREGSRLGLKFIVRRWHFKDGQVIFKCRGSIQSLYDQESKHLGVKAPSITPAFRDQHSGYSDSTQTAFPAHHLLFCLLLVAALQL